MTSMTQSCACVCVTPSFRDGRQRPPTQLALNSFHPSSSISILPLLPLNRSSFTDLVSRFVFSYSSELYNFLKASSFPFFFKKLCFFSLSKRFFFFFFLLRSFFFFFFFFSFIYFEVSFLLFFLLLFILAIFRVFPSLIATRFFRSRMQHGDRVTSSPFAHLFACHLAQRTLPKTYCSIVRPPLCLLNLSLICLPLKIFLRNF